VSPLIKAEHVIFWVKSTIIYCILAQFFFFTSSKKIILGNLGLGATKRMLLFDPRSVMDKNQDPGSAILMTHRNLRPFFPMLRSLEQTKFTIFILLLYSRGKRVSTIVIYVNMCTKIISYSVKSIHVE
jgi:hypothetical protein